MARVALTNAWTEQATTITSAQVQNLGDGPVLAAFAAASPPAQGNGDVAVVGFLLQAGDYLPISGITATNLYLRSLDATGAVEALTAA